MSKLGKNIIAALKEAPKKGLVTLQTSPEVGKLRTKLKMKSPSPLIKITKPSNFSQ